MIAVALTVSVGIIVTAVSRTALVIVSLKDVPPKHRAEVLLGVAACLRWWKR
ncbi:MAG: hypothetical protein WAW17_30300 [Rhodococcus sp. (in: high G+C Gram-positive bacteria)]|uniref:hypothetical protein n=1 Tax=Rhodococcus sp. TaxID=1831 RepID=UPI003BB12E89